MRIGIVYSETSANLAYSEDIYSKLFMAAENQAMMAGIPFDILSEADLTDINKVRQYDTLLFPSFQAAAADKIDAIKTTLVTASQTYGIGMVVQGEFLTVGQTAPYDSMKAILGLERAGGSNGANFTIAADAGHPVMQGYSQDENLGTYNLAYSFYRSVNGTATTLADIVADGQRVPGIIATQTGGRNVHFATDAIMGDNNVLSQALQWSVHGGGPNVTLQMGRQSALVAARVDMDYSQEHSAVAPVDDNGQPLTGINDKMLPIIGQWKKDFNFVGSFYVNIGNDPADDRFTDWAVSGPAYQKLLALGNEIGTHSYTHPDVTNSLTSQQIQFEFQQSKQVIEQQLGIQVTGTAVPGDPESIATARQIGQYFDYMSGGTIGPGAGYLNALGYRTPQDQFLYIAPNVASDFNQIGFLHKTPQQAGDFWAQQWNDITEHAKLPVVVWNIHDYGIAEWQTEDDNPISPYDTEAFTNFWARAYNANAEFVTLDDLAQRMSAHEKVHVDTQVVGSTIRATVTPDASAADVGKFALNLNNAGGQVIKSVTNWYAYDKDSVFVDKNGGEYVINLGTTQDDVTHISKLPTRADLLSVSGDGKTISFAIEGDGQIQVHLKPLESKQVAVVGALDAVLEGDEMYVRVPTAGVHSISIADGGTLQAGTEGVIRYYDQADANYANLYQFADNTGWLQFADVSGQAQWKDFTTYSNAHGQYHAQLVHQDDGSGWTQFWNVEGSGEWLDFTSYSNAEGKYYAQLVHQRDGTGWTQFWDVKNEGTWDEYASYVDGQGRKFEEYILNDDHTVARAYWDVNNQHEWAHYTKIFNPAGELISHYGTNDDGTNWVAV